MMCRDLGKNIDKPARIINNLNHKILNQLIDAFPLKEKELKKLEG